MTDVDHLSTPEWPSILSCLQIDKPLLDIETNDVIGKNMETLQMWELFYKTYSKWAGFSVRIDDVKRKDGIIVMRRWVCSNEGYRRPQYINMENRKKRPRPVTRTGCQAALRVNLSKSGDCWTAKEFVNIHNHETASLAELQFLRSHRCVSDGLLAQVRSMNKVGIKTSQVLSHVALQAGGFANLPCQLRDIYNKVAAARRKEKLETDSEGALGYLDCLSQKDSDFYVEYQVDDENRLSNLFWADGNSRRDYVAFGDVLAFDTTYQTNEYNKPLTILVGVNHHFETCVFGLALLLDETSETFTWLIRVFLDCMRQKHPGVVLTDGDPAMRFAVSQYFPNSTHRLCAWHLGINAAKNVHDKDFTQGFCHLMYTYYPVEVFEEKWAALLSTFKLTDNSWCQGVYEKKELWAETFLRGTFFACNRTTQRCESMNSYLKRFLEAHYPLRDFISHIDLAVTKLRHTELQSDYTSKHTSPQLPPQSNVLRTYFDQCSKVFTRNMYYKVAEQISKENAYSVTNREEGSNSESYSLSKFQHGEIRYKVHFDLTQKHLRCTCMLFESDGIPCRHIWAVLKWVNMRLIPPSLIMKRWRKDAKSTTHVHINGSSNQQEDLIQMSRYGSLNSDTNIMNYYASKLETSFQTAKIEVAKLTALFKQACEMNANNNSNYLTPPGSYRNNPNIIKDPIIVRTKGSGNSMSTREPLNGDAVMGTIRRQRKCAICNGVGHDARNCMDRGQRSRRSYNGASSTSSALEEGLDSQDVATTTTNLMHESTQDSFHSSSFMY